MSSRNKILLIALAGLIPVAAWLLLKVRQPGQERAPAAQGRRIYNGILDMEPPDATLEPWKILEVHSIRLARQVYSSILTYDDSFNIVGDLVSSWEISRDGRTYKFVLKEGVLFHDGTRLTVDDVVASLRKLGGADSTQKELWGFVKKVEKIDEKSFFVELKKRFPPFLDFLTTAYTGVSKIGNDRERPAVVGTGPYRIVAWEPKKRIRLERNPSYHGEKPRIEEINFYIPATAGDIGPLAKTVTLHDLGWYNPPMGESEERNYTELDIPSLQVSVLCLNISKPPFSDYAFRKAFVKAFDKKTFIAENYPGARVASGYLPLGLLGHGTAIPESYYDSGADAQALKRYRGKVALVAGSNTESDHTKENAYFRDAYARFGLDVSIRYLPDKSYLNTFLNGDYDAIKISNEADFPDAYAMLAYFTRSHPMTFLRGGDGKIDEMLVNAMSRQDRNERGAAYGEIDKYIADNYYAMPLYYNTHKRRFHKSLKGIRPSLLGEHLFSIARLDVAD